MHDNRLLDEKSIFLQAIEMDSAEERSAYLDRTCGDDRDLRGRIDALLGAHERPPRLLVVTNLDRPSGGEAPTEERPGSTIGPYKLLEQIGEGGMGAVYLAEQTQPVRRKVALKIIKPGMDTKQVIARFEAERQALALMDHPNIAKVHDAGATKSGRPYFVMELVRGMPVTEYCDREQLTVAARLDLFVLVCRAVQHAHQKGIIHRDLKPSNVMVTHHDGAPVPKVIDFGIAKATDQSLTDHTLLTGVTQLVGTPLYMSPEQAGMLGNDVDTRSDIYSLGVLLYELLTGSPPFDIETFHKAAIGEIQRIIREIDPPTPSTRLSDLGATLSTVSINRQTDARRLIHSVRGELDWIVMKALEKDRTRRYETANDLAADVLRHLNNQPVEACPPSRLYHLQKFLRRHRSRVAAMGLIAVLGLTLIVAVGRQSLERAARQAETASAVTQALETAERAIRPARWTDAVAAVSQAEALLGPGADNEVLRRRTRRLRDDLAMVLQLDEIRHEMSAVKDDHFDTGLADRLYAKAFRDYGIDVEALSPDAVAAGMPAGPVREELIAALDDWMGIRRFGMEKKDDSDWRRLLAAARAADPDPWRNRVREAWERGDGKALVELAGSAPFDRLHPCDVLLLEARLDNNRAVPVLREALRYRPGDFWLNHALGMRLHATHPPRFEEAISYLRAAAALRPESPGAALNLGHVLQKADRIEEAITAYEQAIRLKPDYAAAYSNLGGALNDAGRFDEATRACRVAIGLNPYFAAAHGNLGRALMEIGELDQAITALREALRLEHGSGLAARHLAEAGFRKVIAALQLVHRWIDGHVVRLGSPRPFLQTLLDPRSPPMLRRHFALNLLVAGMLASPSYAGKPPQYSYTNLQFPGSLTTDANGINNEGTISGRFDYRDPTGVEHGFLWSGGAFTQFDVPDVLGTVVRHVNDAGAVVGRYNIIKGQGHGFVFSEGNFTSFDVPGATTTVARRINNSGQIVGVSTDVSGRDHGFLRSGDHPTTIDFPNATSTKASGINDLGQIVGDYQDAAGKTHGFILSGGRFTSFDYPKSVFTQAYAINLAAQIVGVYKSSDGKSHGFVLSGTSYTPIDYPNAAATTVYGINDAGAIVGDWTDAAGYIHGYYAEKR